MVKKKGHSKRSTLKDKYRIQRRVTETHRKRRKQEKKDVASGKVIHKPKDPGIPNSWPFKQDLLKDIARTRERTQEQIQLKKEQRKKELLQLHQHQVNGGTARTIAELMEQAQSTNDAYNNKQENGATDDTATTKKNKKKDSTGNNTTNTTDGQQSRRAYLRELKKVIDQSDVILQVLDARDPISTRMKYSYENTILSHVDKRMVLVLNKIDLVPKQVVMDWLLYLRKSHPTIAIKACGSSTSGGSSSTSTKVADATTSSTTPLGMDALLQLLKNYARNGTTTGNKKSKTTITVGIVGYPNTGKSSIINALKRCRAVGVSARPGFTTSLQEIVLDTNVRLIDSPGIVFDDTSTMLANCVDIESIADPITPISSLLQRANHNSLLVTYNIPTFTPHDNVDLFLALVAKSYGRVLKGGIPDKKGAARAVLRDWNSGKIPYYTLPPTTQVGIDGTKSTSNNNSNDAIIVNSFGPEFDISKYDNEVLQNLNTDEMDCVQLDSTVLVQQQDDEDDDDDNMDDNDEDSDESEEGDDDDDEMDDEDEYDNYDFNEMIK